MRTLKPLLLLAFLLGFSNVFAQSDSITTRNIIEFKYRIETDLIPSLQEVLNFISDKNNGNYEVQLLISNKTKGTLETRIFADDKINVEYDLEPGSDTNLTLRSDMDVVNYLNAFSTSYSKSDVPTIEFTDLQLSPLKKKSYLYYNVVFTCNYYGKHSSGKSYGSFKRYAEVSVDKDLDWRFFIRAIGFVKGTELDSINAYKAIAKTETDVEKILDAYKNEQKQKEEQQKQKILKLSGEGDDLYDKGDFDKALTKYREAWSYNINDKGSNENIAKAKKAIEKKKKDEIAKIERDKHIQELIKNAQHEQENYNFANAKVLCDSLMKDYGYSDQQVIKMNDELSNVNAALVGIETAIEQKNLKDAVARCKEKIDKEYDLNYKAEYCFQMAIIYEKLSKGEQAKILDYLSQSVTHSKSHHQRALIKRADLYLMQGNVISALEDASRIINNDSRNPIHYVYRATIFEKNKQQTKAIDDYAKAIELGDFSRDTFLNKSRLEFANLRYADVVKTTNQGIEKNKAYGLLYYYRGLAKDKQSSCVDAGDDFRKAVEKGIPDSAKTKISFISSAYIDKGNSELTKPSYPNALREFGNAIAIDSNQTGLYKRAICFLNINAPDSALILLNALLNNNTEFADAHNQRGYVYLRQKKFDKALNDFDEEVKRNQLSANAHYGKGLSEFNLEKYTEAAISFERAGSLATSDSTWYYASLSNYNLKKYDKAIECSNKAQKTETKKFEVYYICGRAYYDKKDYNNAATTFSKAFPLVAFDDDLYLYNASANELNGDFLEASSAFDKLSISYKYKDTAFFRSGVCLIKTRKPANYKNAINKLLNYGISDTLKNKGEAFAWLAYVYLSIDSVKQANEFIVKAKTVNEKNYMTQYVVAIANTKDSMFDDAYIALENAMQSKMFMKEEFTEEKLFKPLYKKDKFQILVNRYFK